MRRWTLVGSLALACGDESPIPEAEVADVCGEPGPVQILPLERDEVVGEIWSSARYGDRYLYGIRTFDHPISNVDATRLPASQRGYAELGARIESIDRCGDDRRVIAEGADALFAPRTELEPWLARRSETGMLFWIDPEGRWPARELVATRLHGLHVVTDNLVHVFREGEHDIVRVTLSGDVPIVETVLDRVVDAQTFSMFSSIDKPATVYALRDDGELVLLHLRTGRMESIAKGVAGFVTADDPRYVAWWPGDLDATLPSPVTEALLLDRTSGRTVALGFDEGELSFRMFGPLLVTWRSGDDPDPPARSDIVQTRLTFLPELRSYVLDGKWDSNGSTSLGDRFTVQPPTELSFGWVLLESQDDGLSFITGPSSSSGYDGAFWTGTCDADVASEHARPCDLIRTPFDTLEPEVYERRAWSPFALPEDRWLVFVAKPTPPDAWRPDPRGTLWIIDGATGEETRLDREVSGGFPMLEPHTTYGGVWHTDELVYQVRSLDSDRTGLWRARFE